MDPFLGQLQLFAFGYAPTGWVPCDGKLYPIRVYTALFSLLGTTFGGDGITTFGVPNLQGRTPVGVREDAGVPLGALGGEVAHLLTANEVVSNSHSLQATTEGQNQTVPTGNLLATTSGNTTIYSKTNPNQTQLINSSVSMVGGQPHENRSPFLVMTWCIATVGIFPSRN